MKYCSDSRTVWCYHAVVISVMTYFRCIADDGKLSFEEFNAYFADGILTTEELQELFYSIDGRQNKWVVCFLSFEMGSGFIYLFLKVLY